MSLFDVVVPHTFTFFVSDRLQFLAVVVVVGVAVAVASYIVWCNIVIIILTHMFVVAYSICVWCMHANNNFIIIENIHFLHNNIYNVQCACEETSDERIAKAAAPMENILGQCVLFALFS